MLCFLVGVWWFCFNESNEIHTSEAVQLFHTTVKHLCYLQRLETGGNYTPWWSKIIKPQQLKLLGINNCCIDQSQIKCSKKKNSNFQSVAWNHPHINLVEICWNKTGSPSMKCFYIFAARQKQVTMWQISVSTKESVGFDDFYVRNFSRVTNSPSPSFISPPWEVELRGQRRLLWRTTWGCSSWLTKKTKKCILLT